MHIQPAASFRPTPATAAHLRAAAGEGERPPAPEPGWKVDAAGAFVGGTVLGAAGMYAGVEAGFALASARVGGPALVRLVGLLVLGIPYAYLGGIAGAVVGTTAGAALGVAAARALAKE